MDDETQATRAVFTLYSPTPTLHLVLFVEKLLLGDVDKDQNFYLKTKAV